MISKNGRGILVFLETDIYGIKEVSLEMIGKAMELAGETGKIYGAAVGDDVQALESALSERLSGYPLEKLFLYEKRGCFEAAAWESAFTDCVTRTNPDILLIGGTRKGRYFAGRVAVRFRTGVTADCTGLRIGQDELIQTRPAFGGNIMADIVTDHSLPRIATVREGIFKAPEAGKPRKIPVFKGEVAGSEGVELISETPIPRERGIVGQQVLVACGRGVRKKEDIAMMRKLAEEVGGELASSRALVEKGWMPQSRQIGLSGNVVSPKLLITCGISGTIQFQTGMRTAKNIIAVNTDAEAPIFNIAHHPIRADLYDVVPGLLSIINREIRNT